MAMKEEPEKAPNHERWLISYADFITLLMIFFIVMYSMSNVDAQKYSALAQSLSSSMGGGENVLDKQAQNDILEDLSDIKPTEEEKQAQEKLQAQTEENKLEQIKQEVDQYLQENSLQSSVTSNIEERGLVISLKDTAVFESGEAVVKPESRKKIIEIGKMLNQINNYVRIEGHTDNVPIYTSRFNSNWELSVIRATSVTQLLIKEAKIAPKRLSSIGYGEYRPVGDNSTDAGRAKNRRVDIIIINSKFNEIENNKKK